MAHGRLRANASENLGCCGCFPPGTPHTPQNALNGTAQVYSLVSSDMESWSFLTVPLEGLAPRFGPRAERPCKMLQ